MPDSKELEGLADTVILTIKAALASPIERIAALEAKIKALEERLSLEKRAAALETRVLELEAREASRTVPHGER